MPRFAPFAIALVITAAPASATPLGARSVFLNGIDISTAKSQDLKNVDVHINDNGDIFLIAPHYQVNEEDTYTPLSRYVKGLNQPVHQAPQKMTSMLHAEPGPGAPKMNSTLPQATTAAASGTTSAMAAPAVKEAPAANPAPAAASEASAQAKAPPVASDGLQPKAGESMPPPTAPVGEPPAAITPTSLPPPAVEDGGRDEAAPDLPEGALAP